MRQRVFFTFRISSCLIFLAACCLWVSPRAADGSGNAQVGKSPVRWDVPWPEQGKPHYGYPYLPGVESFPIYHATPLTGVYSHHAQIGHFKGTFFASWSNQEWGEDGPGQRVLCSLSSNGRIWRTPFVCFPSMSGMRKPQRSGRVLTSEAWVMTGGKMYAVAGVNDKPGPEHKIAAGYKTTESGLKRPLFLGRVGWGRVARSVSPNGSLGPIFWLVDDPPAPIQGFPQFPDARDPHFRKTVQAINRVLANPQHMPAWDFLNRSTRPLAADGHMMCEPSVYRRPDGVLVKLSRDCGPHQSHRMYVSLSRNGGKLWSPSVRTNIPDSPSKAVTGTLPDGETYLIGNQVPASAHGVRDPLVISLSPKGRRFNWSAVIVHEAPPRRYPGLYKNLGFQYPSAIVVGRYLWVIYSINKEDVSVSRVPLVQLGSSSIR